MCPQTEGQWLTWDMGPTCMVRSSLTHTAPVLVCAVNIMQIVSVYTIWYYKIKYWSFCMFDFVAQNCYPNYVITLYPNYVKWLNLFFQFFPHDLSALTNVQMFKWVSCLKTFWLQVFLTFVNLRLRIKIIKCFMQWQRKLWQRKLNIKKIVSLSLL